MTETTLNPKTLTLEDFEIRYRNLRKKFPDLPSCTVEGCRNPVDVTELGQDTSCAYHRLLFDYWSYEVMNPDSFNYYFSHKKARRSAFLKWIKRMGKQYCDKLVLKMALEPINWKC